MPAGCLAAGWAAGLREDRTVILVCSAVILVTTLLNLCVRDVHNVTQTPEPAEAA
ncbi:hypothetical protein [Streptomyces sp. NPDC050560]|uniref:hypothetical protein n=1 Tax=Streptomyces sp. NPDC050560 TaxID=3365630 RepID=UPI003791F342